MKNKKIGLVIMASGLGKRYGGNKLMEELGDKPLIKWIIDTTDDLFDRRVVVTRNSDVKALCDSLNIECIKHEFPNRNDTVRLGLSALREEVDYCFFTPGDQPLISREAIAALIEATTEKNDRIIRAGYGKIAGSPMGFPKLFFNELLQLPEGKGGSWIAKNNQEAVDIIQVQDEYELWDIDTVEDMDKIKKILN